MGPLDVKNGILLCLAFFSFSVCGPFTASGQTFLHPENTGYKEPLKRVKKIHDFDQLKKYVKQGTEREKQSAALRIGELDVKEGDQFLIQQFNQRNPEPYPINNTDLYLIKGISLTGTKRARDFLLDKLKQYMHLKHPAKVSGDPRDYKIPGPGWYLIDALSAFLDDKIVKKTFDDLWGIDGHKPRSYSIWSYAQIIHRKYQKSKKKTDVILEWLKRPLAKGFTGYRNFESSSTWDKCQVVHDYIFNRLIAFHPRETTEERKFVEALKTLITNTLAGNHELPQHSKWVLYSTWIHYAFEKTVANGQDPDSDILEIVVSNWVQIQKDPPKYIVPQFIKGMGKRLFCLREYMNDRIKRSYMDKIPEDELQAYKSYHQKRVQDLKKRKKEFAESRDKKANEKVKEGDIVKSTGVAIAKEESSFERLNKFVKTEDVRIFRSLDKKDKLMLLPISTKLEVLKVIKNKIKVKILEGEYKGQTGWAPKDTLRY